MIIEYNTNRIKKTVSDFANLTGLNIAVLDNQFNNIAIFEQNSPDFCKTIQKKRSLIYVMQVLLILLCHLSKTEFSSDILLSAETAQMPLLRQYGKRSVGLTLTKKLSKVNILKLLHIICRKFRVS